MTNNASRWLDLQRSNKNGEKTDICFQEAFAEIMGSEEKIVTSGSEMQLVRLVVGDVSLAVCKIQCCDVSYRIQGMFGEGHHQGTFVCVLVSGDPELFSVDININHISLQVS